MAVPTADPCDSSLLELVTHSPNGIAMSDEQGRVILWNHALEQITGIPTDEAVGEFMWDVQYRAIPEADKSAQRYEAMRQMCLGLLQNGIPDGFNTTADTWIQRPDGARRQIQSSFFALKSSSGYRFAAILRDVTAERAALDRLTALTRAIEQSSVSVVITDSDGVIQYGNPAIKAVTGYDFDEVKGNRPSIFKSGLTPANTYSELWNTINSGHAWHGELLNRKKNGELFWERLSISPVTDEQGEIRNFVAIKEDVTSRKRAELELQDSEERFRVTFEQAGAGIAHAAPNGDFLRINQRFCDLVGYSRAEMLAKNFRDVTYSEDLESNLLHMQRLLNGEIENYLTEKRYVRKDGSLLWVQVSVSLTWNIDGTPKYFIAVIQDITNLKAALQALKRSQAVAHVGDWTWDTHSNTVRWSDEMYRIFDVERETFTGDLNAVIEAAIHPDDRVKVYAANQAVIEEQRPGAMEYRVVRRDGSVRYLWAQPGETTTDSHGKITALSGIVQDTTERRVIEIANQEAHRQLAVLHEALSQQNARLEQTVDERTAQLRHLNYQLSAILDNTSDAILLLNADGQIENSNVAFQELFGYDDEDCAGQHVTLLVDSELEARFKRALNAVQTEQHSQRLELTVRSKSGQTFDADIALAQIKGNDAHIVCSIRDITHLKEVERAKDAFISMISHELRTPIASIGLSSDTLITYYDKISDERRLQKLDQIRQYANVLSELVTSILDFARFNNGKIRDAHTGFDLPELAREVIAELTPQAELKQQRIEAYVDAAGITIQGNRTDIGRIWRNLIGNAIKYCGVGSTVNVTLCASASVGEAHCAALDVFDGQIPTAVMEGRFVLGLVQDNGPGIREDDRAHLFTRFFRGWAAETDIPGTGLGLSLVKEILQAYGGDVVVHSVVGAGTAFCFWLPI